MSVVVRVACSGGQLMGRHVTCVYKANKEELHLHNFPVTSDVLPLYAIPIEFLYICLCFILQAIQYKIDLKATFNGIPLLQLCFLHD